MASKVDLKIDSQEANTGPPTEHREGSVSHADDTKPARPEDGAAGPSAESTKKANSVKEDKKTPKKTDKKTKKAKGKSKPASDSSSGDSEDDEDTNSSSDESTEPELEAITALLSKKKKKRVQKKQQDAQKTGKKSSPKLKKSKKPTSKNEDTDSESETTDSQFETMSDSEMDESPETTSKSRSRGLDQLSIQVQGIQRQMASLLGNSGSLDAGGLNNGALNNGALGAGGLGSGGLGYGSLGSANLGSGGLAGGLGGGTNSLAGLDPVTMNNISRILAERRGARGGRVNPHAPSGRRNRTTLALDDDVFDDMLGYGGSRNSKAKTRRNGKAVAQRMEFKRVDQVWDNQLHNYKLQDTAETANDSQYDEYLFHVRRTFDYEGKYKVTVVDIKSKQLREALKDIMGNIKGVSLVDDTPKLDPNMLFLYLEDMREHMHNLKDLEPEGKTHKARNKVQQWIDEKRHHLKILVKYLDKDYAQTKKSLYPMLENGLITFDLLWALWKPNTLAFTTTYGSADQPRAFKVEVAEKHYSVMKGEFYYIEGKYLEYDGKQFGYGSMAEEIPEFRGAKKITSLGCYPLKYHKHETQLRKELIERGKKFASLGGVHYKSHQGMAYHKRRKVVIKVNINGRIMVDPAIHRRINPNYPVSLVRPKDHDILSDEEESEEDEECGCRSDEGGDPDQTFEEDDDGAKIKFVTKVFKDRKGNIQTARVPKDFITSQVSKEKLDQVPDKDKEEDGGEEIPVNEEERDGADDGAKATPQFTDEEYLIASPVVLGFAFPEKLWLEFTVSGIKEISWNETAYDSLVLEHQTKDIVKALVESHKYHAAESIDDVIQGKGKGLVAVLHGPPGTGKTLTAEGISELLKCPLYMVSAGDLGTDSRHLEAELQKILDICHAWGAILLLDEADVFLEKRNMQDIHRNALVSIFLRQLEYFQGILFLTTNRVQTFDDAFQSRIHIALRYDELDTKAKKAIFKIFIERVRQLTNIDIMPFTEEDYNSLSRHTLNGRQIKNTVGTAQALAVQKREPLSMRHIRQVLDVQQNFERDLRGGTGYQDAMRNYF